MVRATYIPVNRRFRIECYEFVTALRIFRDIVKATGAVAARLE